MGCISPVVKCNITYLFENKFKFIYLHIFDIWMMPYFFLHM